MSTYENYGAFLEKNGIRASSQRVMMLAYLQENHIHPTAEKIFSDLYSKMPTISKATVYNNLKLFVESGIIKEVNLDNSEVHYEIKQEDHAHFVCRKCGKIEDLKVKAIKVDTKPIKGYEIDSQDIFLKGLCKECLKKEAI